MTTYRVCFCFRRRFGSASSEVPEVIKEVFMQYSDKEVMGVEQLQRFLVEVQGEDIDAAAVAAQAILDGQKEPKHHHHHLHLFHHNKGLSLDGFFRFIFGDNNQPISSRVHQDMKAPLSQYFIYTGHNSYLTGNQLSSECSDVPIINALKNGVRVVELDIWPNSTNDDVEVLHGRTLTTPVGLLKCLRSIKEHAFSASPYPVIVTLEDHLTPDLQAKTATMISETFGAMLFIPNPECSKEFPSPEELKMCIIISTKPPKEYLESKSVKEKENEALKAPESEAWGAEVLDFKSEIDTSTKTEDEQEEDPRDEEQKPNQMVASEYKKLIGIAARKRRSEMSETLEVDPHSVTRISLSEQVFEKAATSHGTELIRFTQRNLLRIYPRATRVTSSNYNPLLGWIHGAQMVALNMQGHGRSLWLKQGMFKANGGCGYVKKPDILINDSDGQVFNPKATLPIKKTLKVKVYMGDGWRFDFDQTHFDTYSPPDFYTRVGIGGVPADTIMKRTKTVEDNWIPTWNEEFVFPLTVPELALLRIEVHEYDISGKDDFGGQICLPVWELRPGIRSVPLCDHKGGQFKSVKLLMHFDFI